MGPKIKMHDIRDDRDDDIIELTEDELKEILADDDFTDDGEYEEVRSFYFANSDPYAKVKPRPYDAPERDFTFNEKGNIVVKNPSAFWLPEISFQHIAQNGDFFADYTFFGCPYQTAAYRLSISSQARRTLRESRR